MESRNNTHGQRAAHDTFPDDYLPDSSPRPKYVIATIYPPSREPLGVPDPKPGSGNSGIPVSIQSAHETVSKANDAVLPAGPGQGIIETGWKEASLGIPSGRVAGVGSGSADMLLRTPIANGAIGQLPKSSSRIAESIPTMELPRGKFRALKRNISLISLLRILQTHAFQGSCRINRDGSTILLVFYQGKIILAEYDNLAGDAALNMIYTHRFARIDAIISDLDDAQIRLSLEFNPSWKVQGNQDLSFFVSPERLMNAGRKHSLQRDPVAEPEPQKYLVTAHASEIRPVYPGADSPGAPGESPSAEEIIPTISVYPGEEVVPMEQAGLTGPDGADSPDWRKALTMPLTSSSDEPVSSALPEPGLPQVQGREVAWRAALAPPLVPRGSGVIQKSHETGSPDDPAKAEGWKRALYTPVLSALPEEKQSAAIPDFEPLSADSDLFDEVSVGTKMPRAPGPEPAEQWRSMGMNRGENSSV
jgi:hypothetical protein